jgi:hypothetical protein
LNLFDTLFKAQKDKGDKEIVTLERFGLLVKWFGPLMSGKQNILDNMRNVMEKQ